jgi:MFS family permease
MLISFTLMGLGILGLALIPGYRDIGLAAPIAVVVCRMVQGFALGAEVGPTTAYLIEAAPPAKRARYAAWQASSQNLAAMAGGTVGVALSAVMGQAALDAWGWRIAFGVGALILPVGIMLRRSLPETLHHAEDASPHQPASTSLWAHRRIIALGLGMIAGATVATYTINYMTTYARVTLKLGAAIALAAPVLSGLAGVIFGLVGGALADRFGRRPLLIWPRAVLLAATWPAFHLMASGHSGPLLLTCVFILASMAALPSAATFTAISEGLHKQARSLIFGAVYAIAVATFGGLTQPVIAALIETTGDRLSPAWLLMTFTAIGLTASLLTPETAPGRKASR